MTVKYSRFPHNAKQTSLTRISEGAAKRKNCRVKVLFKVKLGRHLCAETPPKAVKNITYSYPMTRIIVTTTTDHLCEAENVLTL